MTTRRDAEGQPTLDQRLAFSRVFATHGTTYDESAGGTDTAEARPSGAPATAVPMASHVQPAQQHTSPTVRKPTRDTAVTGASPPAKRMKAPRAKKERDPSPSAGSPHAKRHKPPITTSPRGYVRRSFGVLVIMMAGRHAVGLVTGGLIQAHHQLHMLNRQAGWPGGRPGCASGRA